MKVQNQANKRDTNNEKRRERQPLQERPKRNAEAITALADCVSVINTDKWREYLTKWLVAVVANAMDDKHCRNHTCLVLTGEQGKFKTTFLDLLCPPSLSLRLPLYGEDIPTGEGRAEPYRAKPYHQY